MEGVTTRGAGTESHTRNAAWQIQGHGGSHKRYMVRPQGPCLGIIYVSLDLSVRCPHPRFQVGSSIFRRSEIAGEKGLTTQLRAGVVTAVGEKLPA